MTFTGGTHVAYCLTDVILQPYRFFRHTRGTYALSQKVTGFLSTPLLCMVSHRNAASADMAGISTQEISLEASSSEREDSAIHPCTLFKPDNILCQNFQTTVTSEFNEHVWSKHYLSSYLASYLSI